MRELNNDEDEGMSRNSYCVRGGYVPSVSAGTFRGRREGYSGRGGNYEY